MNHHFRSYCRPLYNTCIRCKITLKYCNTAVWKIWIINRSYNLRIEILNAFKVLSYSLACTCKKICMDEILLGKFLHYSIYTACLVKVFHICRTCRCEVAQIRCSVRDLVGIFHIDINTCFMSDSRDMKHCISRAAKCHIHGKSILKGFFGHDISWLYILFQKFHDLVASLLGKTDSCRVYCRDRTIASKTHTDSFCQAVHGIGCVHTRAASASRAYLLFVLKKLIITDLAGSNLANSFEHR